MIYVCSAGVNMCQVYVKLGADYHLILLTCVHEKHAKKSKVLR